ncbi:hypothetical protein GCM10011297_13430 [Bacterioplanes sanyensis]|uniref:type VI secretion system baseplate subunit TssG n=1 Tax=Bacterioplanes sanyensis TaxID=1249553 RepID=UPI0016735BA9|nr:type VI secretion system baseplate subunit TssG [Bacterioplanes sanyensis]GGY41744.1 hypothetical protein GCM10011297_13430 [Bacterioplanes sanyensis]
MASAYWRTGHSVSSLLQSPGVGWDFLQLVRLLLAANADQFDDHQRSDQDLLQRIGEAIRFDLVLDADYPPGEVRHLSYQPQQPTHLTATLGGLSANDGPLPEPFIEWLRELDEQDDHAMLDFLGLFNQRLQALRYLVQREQCPTLLDCRAEHSHSGALLQALAGTLGVGEAANSDLALAGLFANCRMSLPVVRQLLQFELGIELRHMDCLEGGWVQIDSADHTHLGQDLNAELGQSAMLGQRVWDQHKFIHLHLGPVDWPRLTQLIPGGSDFAQLQAVAERISDCQYDCRITLYCSQAQLPNLRLGNHQNPMSLGLTAFLPWSLAPSDHHFQHSLEGEEVAVSFVVEAAL